MGNCNVLEVWRMTPLCLMLYISRERNARSFENRKTSMLELKIFCSDPSIHGQQHSIVCHFLLFLSFWIFVLLFFYIRVARLCVFNKIELHIKEMCGSSLTE